MRRKTGKTVEPVNGFQKGDESPLRLVPEAETVSSRPPSPVRLSSRSFSLTFAPQIGPTPRTNAPTARALVGTFDQRGHSQAQLSLSAFAWNWGGLVMQKRWRRNHVATAAETYYQTPALGTMLSSMRTTCEGHSLFG